MKDFTPEGDGREAAMSLLRDVVEDSKTEHSWRILCNEGLVLSARKGRRDTETLAKLLHLTPVAERRLLSTKNYLTWLEKATSEFLVPILDLRLPIKGAWDELRWLDRKSAGRHNIAATLAVEVARYHEWARLAKEFDSHVGAASDFLRAESRLIIIGGPGSGKSTLLKRIANDAVSKNRS